mgnify:CR=1 FL=1
MRGVNGRTQAAQGSGGDAADEPELAVDPGDGHTIGAALEGKGGGKGRRKGFRCGRKNHDPTGLGPRLHAGEGLLRLGHGLGDHESARADLELVRPAEEGHRIRQSELATGLALEMVALLTGLDQMDGDAGSEDGDREAGKASAAPEIG